VSDDKRLYAELRRAGLSDQAINAAWPSWWSDDVSTSRSAQAELRFTLARRLGLSSKKLLGERVDFVWKNARFKHLSTESASEQDAITSFGTSIGKLLIRATPSDRVLGSLAALELREAILENDPHVNLMNLLVTCWSIGVPVIHLRIFPLDAKRMHAMVIEDDGRYAILLGKDASYPAPVAFTLSHELGHIASKHLDSGALVDLEDPATASHDDEQEAQADQYALALLTGRSKPDIIPQLKSFNAPTLAKAVMDASREYAVEPGTLALCLAYQIGNWPVAMSALRFIYKTPEPAWQYVNGLADHFLQWDELTEESAGYLRNIMSGENA
jgi:hypothetical protein